MNNIAISGFVGKDPELRYLESGKNYCTFSVGVKRYKGKDQDSATDWFRCKAWDKQAEMIGEHFREGAAIEVSGDMEQWETTDDNNNKKTGYTLNVRQVGFPPARKNDGGDKPKESEDGKKKSFRTKEERDAYMAEQKANGGVKPDDTNF